jgi:hypothetical protein
MTDIAHSEPLWLDPASPRTEPKLVPQEDDRAEEWGLGHPRSEAARQAPRVSFDRRESRPLFGR